MEKFLTLFICFLFIMACNKFGDDFKDDLKGDATITGQLSYRDNFSGKTELKVLSGAKVYIAYPSSDSVNYIYYVVTDAQGNFTFKRLEKDADYLLFVNDTINDVHYATYITRKAPADTVKMVAENDTLQQNGMLFYVLNSDKQPISGAKLWLYNNKEIFEADTAHTLSIKDTVTDMYGRAIFYNFNAGTYYVRARFTSPAGLIAADSSYTFRGKGISYDTLLLKTSPAIKNTLLLKVLDESGNLLPGVHCCIFNNPLLFNQESCDGNYADKSSGPDGTLTLTNLPGGNYYVYAQTKVNNIDYKAKVTASVNASGQTTVNIVMKKTAVNSLLVRALDETGNLLPGIQFCVFNNPLQFNQESCNGSYRDSITTTNGTVKFSELPAGNYYLYASFNQGNVHYKAKAFATVTTIGETAVDLILKKEVPSTQLVITAKDNAGTPVNGTSLYFFTSRSLWATDNLSGSVRDTITSSNGAVTIPDMEEGKYYIRARVILDNQVLLRGADSVIIPASPAKINKTILVQ